MAGGYENLFPEICRKRKKQALNLSKQKLPKINMNKNKVKDIDKIYEVVKGHNVPPIYQYILS